MSARPGWLRRPIRRRIPHRPTLPASGGAAAGQDPFCRGLMLPSSSGSFRLFRVAGIDVFLHWSWLVVAVLEVQFRADAYPSQAWNVAEYLALFGLVLLHEFGHALACRQVGGTADRIVLWPLGGVAYVSPPPPPR